MLFAYRCEGCGEVSELLELAGYVVVGVGFTMRCHCAPKPDSTEASLRPIAGPPFATAHDVVRWVRG